MSCHGMRVTWFWRQAGKGEEGSKCQFAPCGHSYFEATYGCRVDGVSRKLVHGLEVEDAGIVVILACDERGNTLESVACTTTNLDPRHGQTREERSLKVCRVDVCERVVV